jgi:hypothetical protein
MMSQPINPPVNEPVNPPSTILPPVATYPSQEALFQSIQAWAEQHGYCFTILRSTEQASKKTITYACNRCGRPPPVNRPQTDKHRPQARIRNTTSFKTDCKFSILAVELNSGDWELRHRLDPQSATHNHVLSDTPAM